MLKRTDAIKNFLEARTHGDLSELYHHDMEVQVNVAQDGGERINGEYRGRKWHGWTDGLTTWKPFRIPYHANTEPEYEDVGINFDLDTHAEAIGMTGWDWKVQKSYWVGFDFDSILGHKDGLKTEELAKIQATTKDIPWVTIRKSTSGKGLHLYVFVDGVETKTHNEHAALARAILGQLSAEVGVDFKSQVDICGGILWVWHRRMAPDDGLSLVKRGKVLKRPPVNWRDHIDVVSNKRRKNLPQNIDNPSEFEELTGQKQNIPLDEDHRALISYLSENNCLWWWDQDHHMLVTHTTHLKDAHTDLNLKGFFGTIATGKEKGNDWNCFCFPNRRGSWAIRRYAPGVQEHASWQQDGQGWTKCVYNKEPDLATAARSLGALEDPKGGFIFREAEVAQNAASLMGVDFDLPPIMLRREAIFKEHKDGRLLVELSQDRNDRPDEMPGWLKSKSTWQRLFHTTNSGPQEPEVGNYDDTVRHLITQANEDAGWVIRANGAWQTEPLSHVRIALQSMGMKTKEINQVLGSSVFKCWRLVNKPFQPEYPGDREWNRDAAQLKYTPSQNDDLHYPMRHSSNTRHRRMMIYITRIGPRFLSIVAVVWMPPCVKMAGHRQMAYLLALIT